MLSVDHIASCKRQDFSGTPGAGLDHKLSNASYRASSPHSSALNRLQAITPVSASSIRQAPVERLQLMPASALSQHLAKLGETALTPNQKILHDAGYQRVTIGGQDNRCWIRAPWFAILNHHMQSGTFSNLKSSIIQTLQSSDNSSVQHWFQQNQATVEEAFAALESPAHTSNFTLNKQGYFCPAVEALIENVSKATFSGNPNSNVELVNGEKISALKLLEEGKTGYQLFSSLLMGQFGANAPLHSEQNEFDRSSMMIEWLGSDQFLNKQAECMIFHRCTRSGHFEIMLKNNDFTPSSSHDTIIKNQQRYRSIVNPAQCRDLMSKFWTRISPIQKLKIALTLFSLNILYAYTAKTVINKWMLELLQNLQQKMNRLQKVSA